MNASQISIEIDKAEEQLTELNQLLKEANSRKFITCISNNYGKGCGKKAQLKNITYIRTHWYVRPHGCTGGDYWNEGEGQYICPHCSHRNRMYDRKEFEDLKYSFKDIEDINND